MSEAVADEPIPSLLFFGAGEVADDVMPNLGDKAEDREKAKEKALGIAVDDEVEQAPEINLNDLPDFTDLPDLGDSADAKLKAATIPVADFPMFGSGLKDKDEKPVAAKKDKTEKQKPVPPRPDYSGRYGNMPKYGGQYGVPKHASPQVYAPPMQKKKTSAKPLKKDKSLIDLGAAVSVKPKLQQQKQPQQQLTSLPPVSFGTNAAVFDIAGIMLKMNTSKVKEIAKKNGFALSKLNKKIPQFLEWKYDAQCKARGVVGFENVAMCILERAKQSKKHYINMMEFNKYTAKETLKVYFTSLYTKNRVYKIEYSSIGDVSLGSSSKSVYQRHDRIRNFWVRIYKKYGAPDDEREMLWSEGYGKPYLKAASGKIVLEYPDMSYKDSVKMLDVDRRMLDANIFTF